MLHTWKKRTVAVLLSMGLLLAGAAPVAAANQGSQENPLVTLSYLQDVFKAAILQESKTLVATIRAEYEAALESKIAAYTKEMEQIVGENGIGAVVFAVVELAQGQQLTGSSGGELILRSGTVSCQAAESPALINTTDGSTLANGRNMAQNNLYLIPGGGRVLQVSSATATVMVRGEYTITTAD